MKFLIVFIVILTMPLAAVGQMAGTLSVQSPPIDKANAPKINCLHPNFDFGNVDEGPDIIHEFHIRNSGKTTLRINNVSTSCGCTAAVQDKKEILPGGKGIIKATYHTNGRPGHATKIITVASNDPVNPAFQLKLDMTVVREVDIQPDRLYIYNSPHGQDNNQSVKILGKPGTDFQILSAQSANGVVTVTSFSPFKDEGQKRTGAVINVKLPASQPIGTFSDTIVVKTNSPKKPEVDVQVVGEVVGHVQYNLKSLNFGPHQEMPVTVTFTTDRPQGFAIREVQSTNHLVHPSIKRITSFNGPDQYLLIVKVEKNIPPSSDGKDQVVVWTNDEEQPKISIDVQAAK